MMERPGSFPFGGGSFSTQRYNILHITDIFVQLMMQLRTGSMTFISVKISLTMQFIYPEETN
jgi:hypothetical protein